MYVRERGSMGPALRFERICKRCHEEASELEDGDPNVS